MASKKQTQPKAGSDDQPKAQSAAEQADQKQTQKGTAADQKINELQQRLDEMEDRFLRAQAELQNAQRHAKEDLANSAKYDGQKLATAILPIVDNLNRALEVKVEDKAGQQLKSGVEMVSKHLAKALSDCNVHSIDVLGKEFDPQFGQAVQTVDADDEHPADHVVKVLQPGYQLADRVIRPAMVVVAK